jgi:FKBP-type peptidyl-prolyl cis-trans isomerase FkpA
MLAYASANGMTMTAHSSGLYYEILNLGSGPTVTTSSKIKITYTGLLLDGTEFDRMDTPNTNPWLLAGLIEGWQIGIPLIQKGGRIRLLIPSALAYGCRDYGPIPGNSPLFFDVALVDTQ